MICHISSAKSCKWYLLEKFRTWDKQEDHAITFPPPDEDYGGIFDKDDDHSVNNLTNLHTIILELNLGPCDTVFIPHITANLTTETEPGSILDAGPWPESAANQLQQAALSIHTLDDESDERITITHKNAGVVCCKEPPPVYRVQNDKDEDGDTTMDGPDQVPMQLFHPFNSDLDWRVGQWAIKNSPGQNALDYLLSVPGVCWWQLCFVIYSLRCFRLWKNLGSPSTMSAH